MAHSLLSLELWVVGLLSAAAVLDPRLLSAACLVAAAYWPIRKWATGRWTRRTPADLPAVLLVLACAVSLLVSALPEITRPQVARLLNGLLLFYALVNWTDSAARVRLLFAGLIAAGIGLAAAAFVTVDWSGTKFPFIPESLYERLPTLVTDVVHPNVLGGSLLLLAPLAAAAALWGGFRSRWGQLFGAAALAWMGAVLVLTQSRGALMGLAFALLVLVSLRWRWGWLVFLAAAIGLGWAVSVYGSYNLADLLFGSRVFGGFRGRMEIWGRGIFMIQDFPFTGIGMGLFPQVVERIYPFFAASETSVLHAHNLFLQVGIDLGIPGLLAWLAIFLITAWTGWRLSRSGMGRAPGLFRAVGAGIVSVQAALLVHGLFDAVVWGQVRIAPLVWVVWGLALAVGNLHAEG